MALLMGLDDWGNGTCLNAVTATGKCSAGKGNAAVLITVQTVSFGVC